MKAVGVRELRLEASKLLEHIEATGESIEITNHGRPVARLVPIDRSERSSLADLIARGVAHPGRGGSILDIEPLPARPGMPTLSELLAEDREE